VADERASTNRVAMCQRVFVVIGRNPETGNEHLVDIWTTHQAAENRTRQLNAQRAGIPNGTQHRAVSRPVWETVDA